MKTLATFFILLIAAIAVQGQQFDINDSLQGWYLFSSNTLDSSGNGFDGTNNGATLTTDRFATPNSAYLFDGVNDHIDLNEDFDYPERTFLVWVNAYTFSTPSGSIFGSDHAGLNNGSTFFTAGISNNDSVYASSQGGMGPDFNIANTNVWHMLTITVGPDSTRFYFDDMYKVATVIGGLSSNSGHPNALVGCSRLFDRYFDGKVDDIRIYNRAIDWCEVRYLYHGDSILPTISVNGFDLTSSSGTSYQWNLNDTAINGATSINHTAIQNGSYTVTVIDTAGCEYTSLPVIITGVGINEKMLASPFDIYPNPTTGMFTVANATGDIQVYDLLDNLVLRTNKRQVDMGSYPAGIYMVQAGEAVRKLIVH